MVYLRFITILLTSNLKPVSYVHENVVSIEATKVKASNVYILLGLFNLK